MMSPFDIDDWNLLTFVTKTCIIATHLDFDLCTLKIISYMIIIFN